VYDGEYESLVKINVAWKDVHPEVSGVSGYSAVDNNCVFSIGDAFVDGFNVVVMGYDNKIRWVRYHNDFYEKFWNADVTPREVIESVKPNFLIEFPYKTHTSQNDDGSGAFEINLVSLKTVMTPEYNYTVQQEAVGE
jgi:formylmethanofuran dehydrogenase subunit A